jgi:translation initiation factor 1
MAEKKHPTVYSTDLGRLCPDCVQARSACRCRRASAHSGGGGTIRVGRESKGRKGKGVTVISGLPLDGAALETLASELKKRCGCGGTVKDGKIEIQGEHRDLLLQELARRGFVGKRCGG